MKKPEKMILTAGPSQSKNEVRYVSDAVENGWNFRHSDYLKRFEKALAQSVGVQHALAVTNGTSALHLGLAACGVGPGDEVIVPAMTYVACARAIEYCGATPVFVDVDAQSWCVHLDAIDRAITPNTKAIMPVWMYGSAPPMNAIMEIARERGLFVVEDSCPALGSTLYGRQAGSFGHAGAFSFQGAKIIAIGEGGGLVTNDKKIHDFAHSFYDHGRDYEKQFWIRMRGAMYKMSNLQAALGLARLEELNQQVEKKRQIFQWYFKRLHDVSCITMNKETRGARSNMWMSSIVLKENASLGREELRAVLREANIDTRPFFYPITFFKEYADMKRHETPNADYVSVHGINLPSGVTLTEEEVDYVAMQIRKALGYEGVQ